MTKNSALNTPCSVKFVLTGFKQLVVESLRLDGLTLTVEKQGLHTSNVTDLLKKLKDQDDKEESADGAFDSKKSCESCSDGGDMISNIVKTSNQAVNLGKTVIEKGTNVIVDSAKAGTNAIVDSAKALHHSVTKGYRASEKKPSTDRQTKVVLKKLQICRIKLEAVSAILSDNQAPAVKLSVADIKYDDFSSHASRPEHILRVILQQIVVTSLNVLTSVVLSDFWLFQS